MRSLVSQARDDECAWLGLGPPTPASFCDLASELRIRGKSGRTEAVNIAGCLWAPCRHARGRSS
eukprot:7555994-Alexandrium_andersonii.AAC.1